MAVDAGSRYDPATLYFQSGRDVETSDLKGVIVSSPVIDLHTSPYGMIRIRAKTINGESWQRKTKINRAVPISSTLHLYLDRYTPRQSEGNWYFPSPIGKRWDPDNFSQDLREANQQSGLPWGCLDYRHTLGSQLAMKGERLYEIAILMGNSPEICRRHYAALTPESLVTTVEFSQHSNGVNNDTRSEPLSRIDNDDPRSVARSPAT